MGFVQSICFSVAFLYPIVQEIHYAPTVCESLAVIHVHFTVGQLVAPLKSSTQYIQVFHRFFFFSTEKSGFASVESIGISNANLSILNCFQSVIKSYLLSLFFNDMCNY